MVACQSGVIGYILLLMKRPPVTLENYVNVYDFYKSYEPSRLGTLMLYGALGAAFSPHVVYGDTVRPQIDEALGKNRPLVIVANHTRDIDPCIMASTLIRQPSLRPLMGNTFIPAKSPIFHDLIKSPRFLNYGLRRAVDGLYAIPVFRGKDYGDKNPTLVPASKRLLDTCIAKLNLGDHMAILGEGERNTKDPTKVQKIQAGVGVMVCRVSEVEQPALLPMGIYYGEDKEYGRRPTVYFGDLSTEPFGNRRDVINWLQIELQNSVDAAVEYSQANR